MVHQTKSTIFYLFLLPENLQKKTGTDSFVLENFRLLNLM
jgi:hypothetical protein